MGSDSTTQKRQDLLKLINHLRSNPEHDESSEATNVVLSRLVAEVRRTEVEEMRKYIQSCPGISSNSFAMETAQDAMDEAMRHINKNSDQLQTNLLTKQALTNSFFGKEIEALEVSMEESSNDSSSFEKEEEPLIKTHVKKNVSSSNERSLVTKFIFGILRCIFMDLPLAATCFILVTVYCTQSIYYTYYVPIMQSVTWDQVRKEKEYTNYLRTCSREDVSTLNPDDFIVDPENTTPEEAVEMTNKHGMTIFPNLLTPATAEKMRDYVLKKNYALSEEEAVWLISNKNRWSFLIGADEDQSIPPVLKEIATNESFQNTISLLMGEDPAMVEFTAITSAYGAGDQNWHSDNNFDGSQMHHARSFVPMYSLFVPLQDTTKEMGATSACPGTHLCGSDDNLSNMCEQLNFQVSDSRGRLAKEGDERLWKTGDGYLMNLNTYHRGPAHIDPNGPERVMLILTISPRPRGPEFDRRQISLGTSYSGRWDMWGHTMKDLAMIDKIKGFPWKQLRTLGIYKPMGTHRNKSVLWGWDYLTVVCSRIANQQFGFRYDDLETFLKSINKKGKIYEILFGQLPRDVDELEDPYVWPAYFEETFARCLGYSKIAFGSISLFYFFASLFQKKKVASISRGIKISAFITVLGYLALYRISITQWGKDIRSGWAQESPYPDYEETPVFGETTLPVRSDILFPMRIDSPFLAGHNLIYNHQPGNVVYKELVSMYPITKESPVFIISTMVDSIMTKVQEKNGRFLRQNEVGDWEILPKENATNMIQRQMLAEGNPIIKSLAQEIKFLKSEARFGRRRNMVSIREHSIERLNKLEERMFDIQLPEEKPSVMNQFNIHSVAVMKKAKKDISNKSESEGYNKGDVVEGYFENDGWFKGTVTSVRRNKVAIAFDDGDFQILTLNHVRKYTKLEIGDEVFSQGKKVVITHISGNGQIEVEDTDENIHEDFIFNVRKI